MLTTKQRPHEPEPSDELYNLTLSLAADLKRWNKLMRAESPARASLAYDVELEFRDMFPERTVEDLQRYGAFCEEVMDWIIDQEIDHYLERQADM